MSRPKSIATVLGTALEVSVKEGKYASRFFTVGFEKVCKSYLLPVVAWPGLIDTYLNICQLESSFYEHL